MTQTHLDKEEIDDRARPCMASDLSSTVVEIAIAIAACRARCYIRVLMDQERRGQIVSYTEEEARRSYCDRLTIASLG
eukprot:6342083-Amphidinium_carterae.3